MTASALQLIHITVDEVHPVRDHVGQVKTILILVKGFRRILGNQDGQAGAGAQVGRLIAQDHRLGEAALHVSRGFGVELGIGIQGGTQVHHVPAAIRKGTKGIHTAAAAADRGNVPAVDLAGHHGGKLLHAGFQRAHFRQVHRAERQVIIRIILQALIHVAFDNGAAQIRI